MKRIQDLKTTAVSDIELKSNAECGFTFYFIFFWVGEYNYYSPNIPYFLHVLQRPSAT